MPSPRRTGRRAQRVDVRRLPRSGTLAAGPRGRRRARPDLTVEEEFGKGTGREHWIGGRRGRAEAEEQVGAHVEQSAGGHSVGQHERVGPAAAASGHIPVEQIPRRALRPDRTPPVAGD